MLSLILNTSSKDCNRDNYDLNKAAQDVAKQADKKENPKK